MLLAMPLIAGLHQAYYYSALPERMASHFGPSGQADGWMSKQAFAIFYMGLVVFFTALWLGIGWLLRHTPDEMINLPNREYWLAPERRDATLRRLGHQMATFGVACIAFFIAVMQSCFLANLIGGGKLDSLFFIYLIGFLLFTGIWTAQMLRESRIPSQD